MKISRIGIVVVVVSVSILALGFAYRGKIGSDTLRGNGRGGHGFGRSCNLQQASDCRHSNTALGHRGSGRGSGRGQGQGHDRFVSQTQHHGGCNSTEGCSGRGQSPGRGQGGSRWSGQADGGCRQGSCEVAGHQGHRMSACSRGHGSHGQGVCSTRNSHGHNRAGSERGERCSEEHGTCGDAGSCHQDSSLELAHAGKGPGWGRFRNEHSEDGTCGGERGTCGADNHHEPIQSGSVSATPWWLGDSNAKKKSDSPKKPSPTEKSNVK